MRFMRPIDRLLWWRRGGSSLTPGTATVTFNVGEDGEWRPSDVVGANSSGGPLIFRMYAGGGSGGIPEEGRGGGGGGGGAFLQGEISSWTASERFDLNIAPGGQNDGVTRITRQSTLEAAGPYNGGDAAGIVPGLGGSDYDNDNNILSNVVFRIGGNGGTSGGVGGVGGGGGSSASVRGAGVTGVGEVGALPASEDGGIGGTGGDGSLGEPGYPPGGGAGGTGVGAEPTPSIGGPGRIVILVPTLP